MVLAISRVAPWELRMGVNPEEISRGFLLIAHVNQRPCDVAPRFAFESKSQSLHHDYERLLEPLKELQLGSAISEPDPAAPSSP